MIRDAAKLSTLVKSIPPKARSLMARFWPGPLTLVFEASRRIPQLLTGGTGKIGIRVPGDSLTLLFLKSASTPITATSANRSGHPSAATATQVLEELGEDVQWVLDGGPTPGGLPSTVVDVTTQPMTVLREGKIPVRLVLS